MVLYLIGLGLGDEKDITLRGLEAIKSCDAVYLEHYTSILGIDAAKLEAFYGCKVVLADRAMVESSAESIYGSAKEKDVALLVVGDPLCATTHTDIMIRARDLGVDVRVVHNASIMGAVASCGLQLYSFGQTVSIPFFEGTWRPDSFYDKIAYNAGGKMHTLCLLDIKVKEPDFDAMARNQVKYLPPRFMTVNTAAEQLLEIEERRKEGVCAEDVMAIGVARLGQPDQCIAAGSLRELTKVDMGGPLHSMVICGELHDLEREYLKPFMISNGTFKMLGEGGSDGQGESAVDIENAQVDTVHTGESLFAAQAGAEENGEHAEGMEDHVPDDDDLFELCGVNPDDLANAEGEDDDA